MTDKPAGKNHVSLITGAHLVFDDMGTPIIVQASAYTGKESIYINGELVSQSCNLKTHNRHHFSWNGHDYVVAFNVVDMMKGETYCSLAKDERIIKTYHLKLQKKPLPRTRFYLLYGTLLLCAVALGYLSLSKWYLLIPISIVLALHVREGFSFVIEEQD